MSPEGQTNLTCAFLCAKKQLSGGNVVDLSAWQVDVSKCSSPRSKDRLGGEAGDPGTKDFGVFLRAHGRKQAMALADRKADRSSSAAVADLAGKLYDILDKRRFFPPRLRSVDGFEWAVKGSWVKGLGQAPSTRRSEVMKILTEFHDFQAEGDNDEEKVQSRHAFFALKMPFPTADEHTTEFSFFWPHDTSLSRSGIDLFCHFLTCCLSLSHSRIIFSFK
jgi:hypothetical protein